MTPHPRRTALPNWAIPALYAAAAVLLGLTLPRLEAALWPNLYAGVSSSAAMAMFSSVGSGMIALTGIVFSLAFVMVQFSATAYSPRLVLWLVRDPLLWHAIGIFCATFLYSIAALAWVDRGNAQGVLLLTVWMVVVLLLASVAMFVALIQKLSLLQVNRMLAFTAAQGRATIDDCYPPLDAARPAALPAADGPPVQTLRHRGPPQSLQALDTAALVALAERAGGAIVLECSVGDTLIEDTTLLNLYGARAPLSEAALRAAFVVGQERTFEQDPKYALRLLVDIAIRALSAAINDPTTAVQAIDHIEDLVLRLGRRRLGTAALHGADGTLRVTLPQPDWDDVIALAFEEIRHCGAGSVQVMRRLRAALADLLALLPPERHPALRDQLRRLEATIAANFHDAAEQREAAVEDRQGLGMPRE